MIRTISRLGLATSLLALAAPSLAAPGDATTTVTPPPVATAPAVAATAQATTAAAPSETTAPTYPALAFDQAVSDEIKAPETAEACAAPDPSVKVYQFHADADTRVEITMTADDFDTVLEIGKMDGCTFNSLGTNDDGGGPDDGLNSRLVARLREAGTYVIHARGITDEVAGKFELKMRRLPAAAGAPTPVAIAVGGRAEGELGPNSSTIENDEVDETTVLETGRPYMFYELHGEAGQEFLIRLESDEFDPVIDVGSMSPLGFSVAATNDDGGEEGDGLNSRLTVTFRTAGTMLIRVSPLSADSGKYTLRVQDPKVAAEEARQEAERNSRRGRRNRDRDRHLTDAAPAVPVIAVPAAH